MVAVMMQVHPAVGSISMAWSVMLVVALAGFSALAQWAMLGRKKLQRVVLAFALAVVFAGQLAAVANGLQQSRVQKMPIYYMPFCADWSYYMNFMCWFD